VSPAKANVTGSPLPRGPRGSATVELVDPGTEPATVVDGWPRRAGRPPPLQEDNNGNAIAGKASPARRSSRLEIRPSGFPITPPRSAARPYRRRSPAVGVTFSGQIFTKVAALPGHATSLTVAAENPMTLVAATNGGLDASFDGGKNWQNVYSVSGQSQVTFSGFTTSTQGIATLQAADGSSTLVVTYDGGHTWSAVTF
jgi:hypothetical protein